jgi:hypothetical protein
MSSKTHLREEKDCLNCGAEVEERFCPHCGQENIVSRQSFSHLVLHFFEDITHYEGKFWKTMRFLLFKPGFLTKEFLLGKRMKYVPPVRLYIFISFITFFLPYVIPSRGYENNLSYEEKKTLALSKDSTLSESFYFFEGDYGWNIWVPSTYSSKRELDSLQRTLPEEARLSGIDIWAEHRMHELSKKNPFELADKFFSSFSKNIAKALFIIMPLFALVLTIFHSRKRWYYFDHAIFTIHLFSFILLCISIINLLSAFQVLAPEIVADGLKLLSILGPIAIFPIYFMIAHKKMYSESLIVSSLKSIFILSINVVFLGTIFIILAILSLLTIT